MSSDNATLRADKRKQRNQLSCIQQSGHAAGVATQTCRLAEFHSSRRIACYLANDGEINPQYIIEAAWQARKQVYIPVLSPFQRKLYFAPYAENSTLETNRFGIPEPVCKPSQWIRPWQLNLMLLPLVAFDDKGNRLGMGGGFYDRSLAYLQNRDYSCRPKLIGLAHELQRTDSLVTNSWDIPLDKIATEERIIEI